jgi:hypothetical protein
MKKMIFSLAFFMYFVTSYSQNKIVSNSNERNEFDGTYQIEIHNMRLQPNIPGNILEIVATNRSENETIYYPLDQNIRIRIPSRNEIANPNFQKLELIKYF